MGCLGLSLKAAEPVRHVTLGNSQKTCNRTAVGIHACPRSWPGLCVRFKWCRMLWSHASLPLKPVTSGSLATVTICLYCLSCSTVSVSLAMRMFSFYYLVSILIAILKVSLSGFILIVFIKVEFIKYKLAILWSRIQRHSVHSQCWAVDISVQLECLPITQGKSTIAVQSLCCFCLTGLFTDLANKVISICFLSLVLLITRSLYKENHRTWSLWGSSTLYHLSKL